MFGFFVFDVSESGLSPQFMVVVSRSKNGKAKWGSPFSACCSAHLCRTHLGNEWDVHWGFEM